jgi:lipopolysaccharide heptosyltransferase II
VARFLRIEHSCAQRQINMLSMYWHRRRRRIKLARKSALILKLGQIGDVIMAIPAAHALYQQGFEIDWVCGNAVRPLLECYSWINVIPANDKAILFGGTADRAKSIADLWAKIAFKKYDLCGTLYYDRRYRLLAFPIRARRKLALSRESRSTTLLAGRHHTDEYTRVLLGTEDGCKEQSTAPVRPDKLPPSPLQSKRSPRRIAVVPGGVQNLTRDRALGRMTDQALRRWPVERYVALVQNLIDRGWEVVLVGSPEDAWVKPHFGHLSITDVIGSLSLPQVVSMFDQCDAIITHDTGPLHMAGLSATPLVGIFGPTDPETRVPRRPLAVGLWGGQGFACRPCYDGRDFAPCQFNGCMHQVTPELVLRELDQLLSDQSLGILRPWRIVHPEPSPDANVEKLNAL